MQDQSLHTSFSSPRLGRVQTEGIERKDSVYRRSHLTRSHNRFLWRDRFRTDRIPRSSQSSSLPFSSIPYSPLLLPQALAIAIESCRLVLVQILLQGMGLDPLSSLYYFAPVCLAVNSVILLPVEGFGVFADAIELVGIPTLFFK